MSISQYLKDFTEYHEKSHFYTKKGEGPGWYHLWSVDKCESCGCDCEAANSVHVRIKGDAMAAFKAHGLTERKLNVPEMSYSEDFGGAVCDDCYALHDGYYE